MKRMLKGLVVAGLVMAAAPAMAATMVPTEVFNVDFEHGYGQFSSHLGQVKIGSGAEYINYGASTPTTASNHFAAFGYGNSNQAGTLLAATFAGANTLTRYTLTFNAGIFGSPSNTSGTADQYLNYGVTSSSGGQLVGGQLTSPDLITSTAVNTVLSKTFKYTFDAAGPFSLAFSAGGSRNDNTDVLLDNVQISASAVPEMATWGMMLVGFGAMGAVMRRRRTAAGGKLANA